MTKNVFNRFERFIDFKSENPNFLDDTFGLSYEPVEIFWGGKVLDQDNELVSFKDFFLSNFADNFPPNHFDFLTPTTAHLIICRNIEIVDSEYFRLERVALRTWDYSRGNIIVHRKWVAQLIMRGMKSWRDPDYKRQQKLDYILK